jgi:hypothetical protein
MVKAEPVIKDVFEAKARNGDGAFAIAYALIDLADAQEATARALQKLGLADASTHLGALEALGMQIEKAATILGDQLESAAGTLSNAMENER